MLGNIKKSPSKHWGLIINDSLPMDTDDVVQSFSLMAFNHSTISQHMEIGQSTI